MASSLSNLSIIKRKYRHEGKKWESRRIKVLELFFFGFCFEYIKLKNDLIECKCLCCNKNYKQKFDEKSKKQVFDKCKFSNHDNNKFILLLRKCVYSYGYVDDCEKLNKIHFLKKKIFTAT